jgi:hypothetical protein
LISNFQFQAGGATTGQAVLEQPGKWHWRRFCQVTSSRSGLIVKLHRTARCSRGTETKALFCVKLLSVEREWGRDPGNDDVFGWRKGKRGAAVVKLIEVKRFGANPPAAGGAAGHNMSHKVGQPGGGDLRPHWRTRR